MSDSRSLTSVEPSEYELLEAALTESARGRYFLAEYARRNRNADTDVLLQAIGRLENAVSGDQPGDAFGRMRGDLVEMAEAIARTRSEIAALNAPDQDQSRLGVASEALDAIVRATERATSDILGAAEEVQEAAWLLRERGIESELCDELDRRATQIYTACSFQDLTAQRTSRVVHTLRYLEDRIAAMIAIWGKQLDEVPPAPGDSAGRGGVAYEDLSQGDVDRFLEEEASALEQPARAAALSDDADLTFLPTQSEHDAAPEPEADEIPGDDEALLLWDDEPAPASLAEPEENPVAETPAPEQAKTDEADETSEKDDLSLAFADLDNLSIEEKIALFS